MFRWDQLPFVELIVVWSLVRSSSTTDRWRDWEYHSLTYHMRNPTELAVDRINIISNILQIVSQTWSMYLIELASCGNRYTCHSQHIRESIPGPWIIYCGSRVRIDKTRSILLESSFHRWSSRTPYAENLTIWALNQTLVILPVSQRVKGAFSGAFRAWKYQKKVLIS